MDNNASGIEEKRLDPASELRVRPLCQKMLLEFTSLTAGVRQAVLASSDGFPLAMVNLESAEGRRLTAMSSTLSSLSRRIVQELGMVEAEATTIETPSGIVFCRQIPNNLTPLVLLAVTDGTVNAGLLNWAGKKAAASFTESLNALVSSA